MKQSAVKLFVRAFMKSFFLVIILSSVGVLSYWSVMHFWDIPEAVSQKKEIIIKNEKKPITEAIIEDISKNLIFCYNEETGEITKILLEIFHCEEKKMQYITIPVRTQFTMSETFYQRMVLVHPTIPQVIRLSNIHKYFDLDTVYDYGVLILEDLLQLKFSYYTAIPQSIYETIFITEGKTETTTENRGDLGISFKEVFSEEYKKFLRSMKTAEELREYIKEIYPSLRSNLSLYGKMNYLDSYCRTPLNKITFDIIQGTDKNSAYYIDVEMAKDQINQYIAGN
ncbi:MAG: hypothetical protein GX306_05285 [Clostridiales bacterium]|nr:hypothetical protein [Clostridiales bacterium]